MNDPAFPPHIQSALDRLTVPPLPQGFGDRLAARIAAGNLPAEPAVMAPSLPAPHRRFGSGAGWRRSGRIVAVVATFGIATATAAASGFFGEPVYVPVVSETLAKARLVELPKAKVDKVAPKAVVATAEPKPMEHPASESGREAVRSLYQRLHADPEYRALPRQERVAIARQEIRSMLQSGEVTLPELRAALAERRGELPPALEQRIRRELVRREWRERTSGPVPLQPRSEPAVPATRQVDPAKVEALRDAYQQLPADQQSRLRELREQLRTVPFPERRAIRQEIRQILQSAGEPTEEKIDTAGEGNPEVMR